MAKTFALIFTLLFISQSHGYDFVCTYNIVNCPPAFSQFNEIEGCEFAAQNFCSQTGRMSLVKMEYGETCVSNGSNQRAVRSYDCIDNPCPQYFIPNGTSGFTASGSYAAGITNFNAYVYESGSVINGVEMAVKTCLDAGGTYSVVGTRSSNGCNYSPSCLNNAGSSSSSRPSSSSSSYSVSSSISINVSSMNVEVNVALSVPPDDQYEYETMLEVNTQGVATRSNDNINHIDGKINDNANTASVTGAISSLGNSLLSGIDAVFGENFGDEVRNYLLGVYHNTMNSNSVLENIYNTILALNPISFELALEDYAVDHFDEILSDDEAKQELSESVPSEQDIQDKADEVSGSLLNQLNLPSASSGGTCPAWTMSIPTGGVAASATVDFGNVIGLNLCSIGRGIVITTATIGAGFIMFGVL